MELCDRTKQVFDKEKNNNINKTYTEMPILYMKCYTSILKRYKLSLKIFTPFNKNTGK